MKASKKKGSGKSKKGSGKAKKGSSSSSDSGSGKAKPKGSTPKEEEETSDVDDVAARNTAKQVEEARKKLAKSVQSPSTAPKKKAPDALLSKLKAKATADEEPASEE